MIDLSDFFSIQTNLIRRVPKGTIRFLYEKINWRSRLFGVIGGRGTGKSTLLLQYLAMNREPEPQGCLYLSADNVKVEGLGLYEIVSDYFRLGGKEVIIDEIHKSQKWPQIIKNLYDSFPDSRIRFSGSSALALQLGKTDLSRRAVFYKLPGMSFREYLSFTGYGHFPCVRLDQLLEEHVVFASHIMENGPILGHFHDYLDHGIYPFFGEGLDEYLERLKNVIEKVLFEDIVATTNARASAIYVLKRILWLVATSQPFEPNVERISRSLGVSKPTLYGYLEYLERSGLIAGIMPSARGHKLIRKPAKLYIDNTNLLKAIGAQVGIDDPRGTLRETFFQHQIRSAGYRVSVPPKADFLVEDKYVMEIGGRSKGGKQIAGKKQSYVVRDDIEMGYGNVIPLWLFGFLY
ncbi:MAG: ATP-binding protein [Deltaproteobacteria bacterium]|nr:ATP-binding protein [Deltaproteobacteria bacterium]MBW2017997.1 ATP-binding protein [Deltaproteobacteria bacterium]MBW2113146.1 ATP-binding protein [Deltaproteobacteria bacterium]